MTVLLITNLTLVEHNSTLDIELPFAMTINADTELQVIDEGATRQLRISRHVPSGDLELVPESGISRRRAGGTEEPSPALRLRNDEPTEAVVANDFLSALSFLTDVPLRFSHRLHEDRYEPETEADRQLLDKFGTDRPYAQTSVRVTSRTFGGPVTVERLTVLAPRRVGLRIYAAALHSTSEVAQ